jgi:hypothetical protein
MAVQWGVALGALPRAERLDGARDAERDDVRGARQDRGGIGPTRQRAGWRSRDVSMTFDEFERARVAGVGADPGRVPRRRGRLVVERAARPHPTLPDVYTLGECLTESYPSAFGDADTIRSVVVLYYGSFFRLSRSTRSSTGRRAVGDADARAAASPRVAGRGRRARRHGLRRRRELQALRGRAVRPVLLPQGLPEDGWLRVDDEFFLELIPPADGPLRFDWRGTQYTVDPPPVADVAFVTIRSGVADPPAALHLVVVRRTGWRDWLRSLRSRNPPRVLETNVDARPAQLP